MPPAYFTELSIFSRNSSKGMADCAYLGTSEMSDKSLRTVGTPADKRSFSLAFSALGSASCA